MIVIKRSMNPGFAGIENELYYEPETSMLFGDAKSAVADITAELGEHLATAAAPPRARAAGSNTLQMAASGCPAASAPRSTSPARTPPGRSVC